MGTLHQFRSRYPSDDRQADQQYRAPHRVPHRAPLVGLPSVQIGKRVVLRLGKVDPNGIPVTLQIGDEGRLPHTEMTGWLPPVEALIAAQQRWHGAYQQQHLPSFRLKALAAQVTNVSDQEGCDRYRRLHRFLKVQINRWLNSELFRTVRETLLAALSPTDAIRFVLQTDDLQIRALPLHVWDWFERYTKAELVLSGLSYRQRVASAGPSEQVRILAILGESQGLDVQHDLALLKKLPDVALTYLVEPDRSQLNDTLWEQPWDILFFAGHSTCGDSRQQLRINPHQSIALSELKYGLRKACDRGLKLAILNTCDGLQLINELNDELCLPPSIVMRHPVPDAVAQSFLKHFLLVFSQGSSLFLAVREARERMQGLEAHFPCATWLPVLFQNPSIPLLTWDGLKCPV